MTSQFDFTNAEWADIAILPVLVGVAVAKAEDSGRFGSMREIRTLTHTIRREAPDNDAKALIEAAATVDAKEQLGEFTTHSPEVLADIAVRASAEVARLLRDKADAGEASAYLNWVYDVGEGVARAAREHGVRVSPPEVKLLDRVAAALRSV